MNCGDARFRQKLYVCVYVGVVELTSALTSHLMDSKSYHVPVLVIYQYLSI